MRRPLLTALSAGAMLLPVLAGCGSDPPVFIDDSKDTGTSADSGATDSAKPDSATPEDSAKEDSSADSAPVDSGVDTGSIDTGAVDTGTIDTGSVDTGVDTGTADTGSVDTGSDTGVSDTGSDTGTLTLDAACDSWTGDFCSRYDTCSSFFLKYVFGDVTKCKERLKISCLSHFGATGSGFTPGKVVTCGKSYATKSCLDMFDGKLTTECSIPGPVINGKACGSNAQCASGFCALEVSSTCGACAPPPAAGTACLKGQCAEGMDCVSGLCQVPGRLGDACSTSKPCGASFSCFGGKCVTPGKGGEACDASQISAKDCSVIDGLYCDPSTSLCKFYALAKPGESCGALTAYTACSSSGFCKIASGSTTGTCMSSAGDGASCDDTTGPKCMSPAYCLSSVCRLSDPSSCK